MIEPSQGYQAINEPVATKKRNWRVSSSFIRFIGASVAIAGAIVSWVIMAEKLQGVNKKYPKPFFITYWVHGFGYSLLYVVWQAWLVFPGNLSCNRVGEGAWRGKSSWQLLIVSGVMAAISFTSAYAWYYSLTRTNIPANTAIYQSACVWVFLLSIFLLRERVTVLKIAAVIVSVAGVSLVSAFSNHKCESTDSPSYSGGGSGSSSGGETWQVTATEGGGVLGHIHRGGSCTEQSTFPGYIALFYSVISYAVFEVSYKKWGSKKEDSASVPNSLRVLGYMGVHTLFWFWPFFFILHFSKIEPFEWPSYDIFMLLVWNAFLDIMFNAGLLVCIALSSALFASVGTILVIPGAILADWILQGYVLPELGALGVALIIVGFVGFLGSEVIAMKTEHSAVDSKSAMVNGKHLQSSVCSREEDGDSDTETTSLLRSRHRRRQIIKYLF